jgi:hypothetical protein
LPIGCRLGDQTAPTRLIALRGCAQSDVVMLSFEFS